MPSVRRCFGSRLIPVVLFVVVIASADVAYSQEGILGGIRRLFGVDRRPAVVEMAEPAPEVVNQFTPHLKKVLTAEIHFVRKVCRPDAEQLAAIRKAGVEQLDSVAKQYAKLQQGGRHSGFPDARELIAAGLQKTIDEVLPEEAAQRYRDENAARIEARRQAVTAMMTTLIDRELALTPEQFDQVDRAIGEKWDDQWGRNLQMFLYDQYAPMPHASVLTPLLNEQQKEVWKGRVNHGMIHFGWEQDLGVNWMGGAELQELDEYPAAEEQVEGQE
jgi:hypothetical protein